MSSFKAYRIHQENRQIVARFEQLTLDDLAAGDVVIRVSHSGINYKDALAATGAGKILRKYPLVGGIDLAGVVETSTDARYAPGDVALVTGCDLSESHDGGYAEFARVKGDWVIPMPHGLDAFSAMAIGTAGFTAALAIHRMQHNGLTPAFGPIAVSGATGGVGSLAIDMLSSNGFEVTAITSKTSSEAYLRSIGASAILPRRDIEFGNKPLQNMQFGGAIDNLGGEMLSWLCGSVAFWGSVASIGLASSAELHTTVLPFILRGVNLLGINSSATPRALRLAVWQRIATDLRPRHLDQIAKSLISFDELPAAFAQYIAGGVVGRTVVRIG